MSTSWDCSLRKGKTIERRRNRSLDGNLSKRTLPILRKNGCYSNQRDSYCGQKNTGKSVFSTIVVARCPQCSSGACEWGQRGKCVPFLKRIGMRLWKPFPLCRFVLNVDAPRFVVIPRTSTVGLSFAKKGHLRTDEAFVLSAMRNWNKKVGQYVCDNQNQRLGQCLTEFWYQGDTSDENLPEFMRQSWREKYANWEGK